MRRATVDPKLTFLFPFWVAFAWLYEFTPEGIKRESEVAHNESITHTTARKLDFAVIARPSRRPRPVTRMQRSAIRGHPPGFHRWRGCIRATLPPTLSASATSSISGTYSLSWNAVSTATGYTLSQNGTTVYTGSSTSWSSNDLGNGSYTYTVQSCNASGCGGASNAVAVTVNHIPAPGLSASTTTSSSGTYTLSWNTVANATSYELYQNGAVVYNSTGTTWTSNDLANGTYAYTVYGCNGSTCGFVSNQVTVTVLHVPPAPTLSASTTSSTTGGLTLSWTAATGASSYEVEVSANGGAETVAWTGASTSWSPSGLADGSYAYQVLGDDASGWGPASNAVTVTVLVPPTWVTKPPAIATVNTGFTISWSAVAGATSYNVQQTESGKRDQTTTIYSGSGTAMTVTLSGIATDTFYYAVQACWNSQCSAWVDAPGTGTDLEAKGGGQAVPATGSSSP